MVKTLTAANAIITLGVTGLFPTPVQLQGFAPEDMFDAEAVDVAETVIGVDGILSAGWVPSIKKLGISIQADSDSIDFFEQWNSAQTAVREIYFAFGTVYLRATQKKYGIVRAVLKNYKPIPDAKKILQARKFTIECQSIVPAAI